ncbi:MAG: CPBP family intramembrane metalloprotease [Saprospiraceae bacterium]|nr:CPBP family intramembrane metalloprotease [Saprospiraceae bacterium]
MFFQAAANGSNSWWQYLFGIVIVALGYLLGQVPLGVVTLWAAEKQGDLSLVQEFAVTMDFSVLGLDPNLGFALALTMFLGALLGLWIVIRYLHQRPFLSLINHLGKIRWSRFLWGAGIWLVLGIVAEGVSWIINPEAYHLQFEAGSFFMLLVIALVLIPFQASFEELFVRGYLMQGIGLGTHSRVIAMVATSFLFAGLHLMNPEISEFGLTTMVAYYVLVGLFLAIITVMDDGLELAMGVHTATNLYGSILITFEGSALQTPALIHLDVPNVQIMLLLMVLSATIFLLLASKKYGWAAWTKLSSPMITARPDEIVFPNEESLPQSNS